MLTTDYYSNRDIDAKIMLTILQWGYDAPTEYVRERMASLEAQRKDGIRNYKDVAAIDSILGNYRTLLDSRERWSSHCFDDCSHWASEV